MRLDSVRELKRTLPAQLSKTFAVRAAAGSSRVEQAVLIVFADLTRFKKHTGPAVYIPVGDPRP